MSTMFTAQKAAKLSAKQISLELHRRGLRATQLLPGDIAALQGAFNAEFVLECEERATREAQERAAFEIAEREAAIQRCVFNFV